MTSSVAQTLVLHCPAGWEAVMLRRLARVHNGGTPSSEPTNWDGDVPFVTPPDLRDLQGSIVMQTARRLTMEGVVAGSNLADSGVIISNRAPIGYVARLNAPSAFNQGCKVLQPSTRLLDRYLAYCMVAASPILRALGQGTTFMELSSQNLTSIRIPLPNPRLQRQIADFLDRETEKIDALVSKQAQLISTLRERRVAIAEAILGPVVGGGQRLRWGLREVDERAEGLGESLPLLSVSIDWGVRRRSEVDINQAASDNLGRYKLVSENDVVVNRMRAFQGALGVAVERGITSPDYAVFRPNPTVLDALWLSAVMRTPSFVAQMASRLRGIGTVDGSNVRTPRVSASDVREIRLSIPDLDAQASQINELSRETATIDESISKTERMIVLSRERRSALITAAVSGQIDVTGEGDAV